ncbi:hypothetical protein D3C74_491640 [compost metagenome]
MAQTDDTSAMPLDEGMLALAGDMPLRVIAAFDGMLFDEAQLDQLLAASGEA